MMRFFLLFLFACSGSLAFGQTTEKKDSLDYKVGEFYVLNGATDTCYVSRTETRQKEHCTNSEAEYEFIVIWLKDRKYVLRDIQYNPSTKPAVMRRDVVVTIMEVGKDYHVVHARKKGLKPIITTVYCNKQAQ